MNYIEFLSPCVFERRNIAAGTMIPVSDAHPQDVALVVSMGLARIVTRYKVNVPDDIVNPDPQPEKVKAIKKKAKK